MKGAWLVAIAVLVAAAGGGCAGAAVSPSPTVTTLAPGWEHYFQLDWAAQPHPGGTAIDGYIYNGYISPVTNVQVLAQAMDGANNVVAQRIEWVPRVVPALDRSYFRIAALPRADHYRVTVWAFDVVQTPGTPLTTF